VQEQKKPLKTLLIFITQKGVYFVKAPIRLKLLTRRWGKTSQSLCDKSKNKFSRKKTNPYVVLSLVLSQSNKFSMA